MPHILILDDQATNRRVLERMAASIAPDVSVISFSDPIRALDWLEENSADLIITDYKMPSLDGAEFTRKVRSKSDTSDIPIIVITIHADREFRLLSLDAGATDFLLSPIDPVEFSTRVRNLLALRRHQVATKQQIRRLRVDLDASERLRVDLMRESRESLAQVIDTLHAMISAADRDGHLIFVNVAQASEIGKSPEELVGLSVMDLFGPTRGELSRQIDADVFRTKKVFLGLEETVQAADGTLRYLSTTKAPLRDSDGNVSAVLTTSIDITDQKVVEERLLYLAQHDPLTELPNRAFLSERLRERCGHGRRSEDGFALHFLDLDRFKAVNDALGHQVGDKLLKEVAKRLKATLREGDVVARLGGDEFAILQNDIKGPTAASLLATRVLNAFRKPFRVGKLSIATGTSLGITLFPKDALDADALLRNADLAMYRAKSSTRGGFSFFDQEMDAAAQRALQLESELRRALARGEFELAWQPQVSLQTGSICGAEALLRWNHPERGVILPADFLGLAEEVGLIAPITEWVLATACAQGAIWARERTGGVRIAVNLSPSLFVTRDVQRMITEAITVTGLSPGLLDVEITERILLSKLNEATATLIALRELGVTFSIDDFGTGYSSLTFVRSFPIQRLKVDQTYIGRLGIDRTDTAIVSAILHLAHGLKMQVVAEGVETASQLVYLKEMGCDEVQGFFVQKPLSAEILTRMLQSSATNLLYQG
jgi:diguanylate cyclase (GGDEF)-like protein/PAS domain S-box-containing protein